MPKKISSLQTYKTLLAELKGSQTKPVYAFFGAESFFIDRLQDAAIDTIPAESRDFNLDVLYGLEVQADKVVDICRSYPMMSEHRVVIVRDFMKMFERNRMAARDDAAQNGETEGKDTQDSDEARKEISLDPESGGQDSLITYLNQPNPSTLLILTNEKAPVAHSRMGKSLNKNQSVRTHKFDPVEDEELPRWIIDWAKMNHDLQFEETAALRLGFQTGSHLHQLTVEIEKLANFKKGDGPITEAVVQEMVGLSREFTIFDFSNALLDRQTEKAMFIAQHILRNSESAVGEIIRIIAFLYSTFGKIWHIHRLSRKGLSPDQIRDHTGISSKFYYQKLVKAGRDYPLEDCPRLFETLLDADKAVKGFSKETPEAIMLMTIKKLTG